MPLSDSQERFWIISGPSDWSTASLPHTADQPYNETHGIEKLKIQFCGWLACINV
ncbi:MAG: hypothetical protein Q9157_004545 [Trypethelium eluteriae]